jgi:hypothetical protein
MLDDGIAATNDPVLLFRSSSYAVSHTRRLKQVQRRSANNVDDCNRRLWAARWVLRSSNQVGAIARFVRCCAIRAAPHLTLRISPAPGVVLISMS